MLQRELAPRRGRRRRRHQLRATTRRTVPPIEIVAMTFLLLIISITRPSDKTRTRSRWRREPTTILGSFSGVEAWSSSSPSTSFSCGDPLRSLRRNRTPPRRALASMLLVSSSRALRNRDHSAAIDTSAGLRCAAQQQETRGSDMLTAPSDVPTTAGTYHGAADGAWTVLWNAALNATSSSSSGSNEDDDKDGGAAQEVGGHDSFRYEWGTWVEEGRLRHLMETVIDNLRLGPNVYDKYTSRELGDNEPQQQRRRSIRIAPPDASDKTNIDVWLHLLPPGCEHRVQYPSGSWTVVKCLTGFCEIVALPGSRRGGPQQSRVVKQLRGGTDGSLGSGQAVRGDACVKYVGGPVRGYRGKYGKTAILEIVLRPPILTVQDVPASAASSSEESSSDEKDCLVLDLNHDDLDQLLTLYEEPLVGEDEVDKKDVTKSESSSRPTTSGMLGLEFERVGGLDSQLKAIARRVLATRANPGAAKRLGIGHVRGILLSGPPGCGKTLMARELSTLLNAREPQIVNGPEILDKYIGEAEKKVRALFVPAEQEYAAAGDDAALHIIILDEMDAIARKRGSMTSDTTGVRDSVVNQLLAKMDGVNSAPNVLVIGLTNRPELLDPALLRPGRLEVQLRVELPDAAGRRDILRIHTRQMAAAGGMAESATRFIENLHDDDGLPARTEHYTGAELAGLVRSAASFALARMVETTVEAGTVETPADGMVTAADLKLALAEVRPALGKQDDVLQLRYPMGIIRYSSTMDRILRDLDRFTAPVANAAAPRVNSLLLVGGGGGGSGTGVSALAAYAAHQASLKGRADYVRFLTALDVIVGSDSGSGSGGEEARAAALLDKFAEARELPHSLLVLDDVDQLCAGSGPGRYSSVMLAALRALLRTPPASDFASSSLQSSPQGAADGDTAPTNTKSANSGRSIRILAVTSRSDAACNTLHELFEEVVVVPTIKDPQDLERLLASSLEGPLRPSIAVDASDDSCTQVHDFAKEASIRMLACRDGQVGCKTALRWAERAVTEAAITATDTSRALRPDINRSPPDAAFSSASALRALDSILQDVKSDELLSDRLCEIVMD